MNNKMEMESQRLLNEKAQLQLDLSNPVHEKYFLEIHGGEKLLKNKYKAVYKAFQKTKELHIRKKMESSLRNGIPANGGAISEVSARVGIPEILESGESGKVIIKNDARINVNPEIMYVSVDGAMVNPNTRFCYGVFWNEYGQEEISGSNYECSDVIQENFSKSNIQEVETSCNFDYVNRAGILNTLVRSSNASYEDGNTPIEKFEISAPRSYKNPPNKPVLITYKGRSGFNGDYDYPDNKPVEGQIKTRLPITGYIIFKNGYTPVELSDKKSASPIELIYAEELSVGYGYKLNEIKKFFWLDKDVPNEYLKELTWVDKKNPNPQRVNFRFNDDWRVSLPSETYGVKVNTLLSCPFFYKTDNNGKIKHIPLCISSAKGLKDEEYYISKNSYNVRIPEIQLIWGCFGKNTRIEMGDGTRKAISEIKKGDMVATYGGQPAEVRQFITGSEEQMIHITTEDGKELLLSDTHPVMTGRGMVRAKDLNAADEIMLSDNTKTSIRYLFIEEYHDTVYNLDLGKSHIIVAEGILAGDFHMQNEFKEEKPAEPPCPEVLDLIHEIKMLKKELRGKTEGQML